jgi:hypothetical protein
MDRRTAVAFATVLVGSGLVLGRGHDCIMTVSSGSVPVATQLPLLAYAGHVVARLANGPQRAPILGRERAV